jgi:hypothetical protein
MSTTTTTPPATLTEFQQIEADVMGFITKVVNEVEVLVEDAITALENVAAMMPQASAWIESAITFIEGIPVVGQNPEVLALVGTVDLATKGLDAFASAMAKAQAPGGSITVTQATQAVVAGVQAFNLAKTITGNIVTTGVSQAPATAAVIASTPTTTPAA